MLDFYVFLDVSVFATVGFKILGVPGLAFFSFCDRAGIVIALSEEGDLSFCRG